MMGRLSGTVLGAGLGMLFAPRAGSELRSQLTDQAGDLGNQASEKYRRATVNAGEWVDGGRDMYDNAENAVSRDVENAQRHVGDAASVGSAFRGAGSHAPSTDAGLHSGSGALSSSRRN
jgi:gas vesicle protein